MKRKMEKGKNMMMGNYYLNENFLMIKGGMEKEKNLMVLVG